MKIVTLESGFKAHMLNQAEQQALWDELMKDVSPLKTGKACYTPHDNIEYYWISETEISFEKYEAILSVNGKNIKVRYNVCNMDEKINKAVRKAIL